MAEVKSVKFAPPAAGTKVSSTKISSKDLQKIDAPVFWRLRNDFFDRLYKAQEEEYKTKASPIEITLPDGNKLPATAFETTPLDIARIISRRLADRVLVSKVDDILWDLGRPLENTCSLELLDWDCPEARKVFWHSSSHVLGHALERGLGIKLSVGPPLEEGGFFYEGDAGRSISETDYPLIEACMQEAIQSKKPFQRLVVCKADALAMFAYNPMKATILQSKVPEGGSCTVYRCGDLIDPCRGPHLPDMGKVKCFAVTRCSASYFLGKAENQSLQRVYGISFPKDSLLKEWKVIQEEASKRDHRTIGKQQELWMWNELSPGSTFFYPHGARIYNTLMDFMRKEYRKRGFEEVITPNIYNSKLWQISGHSQKYRENFFYTQVEKEEFALKPMNCPGHCLLYSVRPRSYRELPLRLADFGVLHRNEISGALSGLIRVRRFQQDDAHIFCTPEQVRGEILGALNFLRSVYETLGFTFSLSLSTRPTNFMGAEALWDIAEVQLEHALNDFCGIPTLPDPYDMPDGTFQYNGTAQTIKKMKRLIAEKKITAFERMWDLNPGDGAFYGPKIDVTVMDALHRKHQCGTIQLDFQLPRRFNLSYVTDGEAHELTAPLEQEIPKIPEEPEQAVSSTMTSTMTSTMNKKPHKCCGDAHRDTHSLEKPLDPGCCRPIMIHRAIFGSLERCIAILTEHHAGRWPFWLSPRQAVIVPVSKSLDTYAKELRDFFGGEFYCDVDLSDHKLEKKIRNNQIAQYNYILVVGKEEEEKHLINVRCRENKRHGMRTIDEVMIAFRLLRDTHDTVEVFQKEAPEAVKAAASAAKLVQEMAEQERMREEELAEAEAKNGLSYELTMHIEPISELP